MFDDPVMLFELTNVKQKKRTHCGVLEFTAEEGVCYIPYWMMQNLLLTEGDVVKLQYTKLEKGNFVKLRPQTKDFLDISDPKAVLEMTLRRYTCLTLDDTIMINYNNRRYFVDIVELKPDNAVCILDCDLNTDFAPPLDYVEPEPVFRNPPPPSVNGGNALGKEKGGQKRKEEPEPVDEGPKFLAFAGGGNRLDGKSSRPDLKPVEVDVPTTSLNIPKEFERFIRGPKPEGGEKKKEEEGGSGLPRRKAGKLVFGGARKAAAEAAAGGGAAKEEEYLHAKERKKFDADTLVGEGCSFGEKTTVKRSLAVPASVGNGTVFVPALIYASEYKRHQTAELVARALRAGFRGVDRRRLFFRLLRRGPALGRVDAAVLGGSSRHGGLAVRTPKSR